MQRLAQYSAKETSEKREWQQELVQRLEAGDGSRECVCVFFFLG